jgi:antibiotic biosynthesis monooxygenase (ABM) superfamily enzyme
MNEENKGPAPPAAVVITMRLRPGVEQEFSSWHAKISTAAAGCAGFISAEVSAAVMSDQQQRQIIQHFRDADSLHAWRQSEPYRDLLLKADSLVDWLDSNGLRVEEATGDQADGPVTEVFTTRVKPDKVGDYQEWAARIHKAEAQFPGYRGGYLQPPVSANQPYWTSLVRFATAEQLDKWLNSDERRELLRDHDALVSSWESHHLPSAFAGWFPADQASGASPPAWKESMVVMLVLFPLVMLELRLLHPLLGGLNRALAVFIEIAVSVVLTTWPFVPLAISGLKWWLLPSKQKAWWINPAGIVLLLALYAAEIAALWHLFP